MTSARLDEPRDMVDFLAAIPNGAELGKIIQARGILSSRAYDDAAWTARFVASDGDRVQCFTVTDITIDQAEMIAAVGMDIASVDAAAFRETALLALGPTVEFDGGA